ncbi:MAG TPA: hypothetical protein VJ957_05075, partial [Longimicrobiales bacterium]|nr:hypothetical protein [Longimicrobiales bacterium]
VMERTFRRMAASAALGFAMLLPACLPPASPAQGPAPDADADAAGAPAGPGEELPAAGYGTLRQDAFTVQLRRDALLIKVTPLEESVIRLAAPDTYQRLHRLAETLGDEARSRAGGGAVLFLVSFFSYQPDTFYEPENVQIVARGRQLGSRAIVPLTPGWGRQRLRQQETESAVYAFPADVDLSLPFQVRYGMEQSDAWSQILPVLDRERARAASRAGRPHSGMSYSLILR